MRTTLTIDDRALAAARGRARRNHVSVGEALSQLALRGLAAESPPPVETTDPGLIVLPAVPGFVLTSEMVADALDQD